MSEAFCCSLGGSSSNKVKTRAGMSLAAVDPGQSFPQQERSSGALWSIQRAGRVQVQLVVTG